MRKSLWVVLALMLLLPVIVVVAQDEPETLVVSTFGFNLDVIEENVTQPFEEAFGVDVIYDTGNNSDRFAKLESLGDESEIDVVHFAGAFTFRAKEAGLLQEIDPEMLENYDDLFDWAQDPLGDNAGIAYAINSYLLIYRSDLVEEPITSWADLLRDDVAGFVTIPQMTTTFGPATLLMLDKALSGSDDINYDADMAWEALPDLADNIVTSYIRSSELTTLVQQEEVWLAPYASFAIGNLLGTGHPLTAVVPEEGVVGGPIVVSITAATEKVELAHAYIDWLISYEVQMAEAVDLIDSPTNMVVQADLAAAEDDEMADACALLTCGADLLDSLIFIDNAEIEDRLDDWIERWNEALLQ
ncbi:MAG: extracellular solute-binding protein [Anaerolineae bacterium]|nr:extracellular solute-binding protein [Anaerolineae bacterium]